MSRKRCATKLSSFPEYHDSRKNHLLSVHKIWSSLFARCYTKSNNGYATYGARGVIVCSRWFSFKVFYEDLGRAWQVGLTIERLDPTGNYEPSNCVWATKLEQQRNKRNTIRIQDAEGNEFSLAKVIAEFAPLYGVPNRRAVIRASSCGWSFMDSISVPVDLTGQTRGVPQKADNQQLGCRVLLSNCG
jgi:hypothetical protein